MLAIIVANDDIDDENKGNDGTDVAASRGGGGGDAVSAGANANGGGGGDINDDCHMTIICSGRRR